jgi:hypothetical protein
MQTVFVVVSGGVVQDVCTRNLTPVDHEVIDWDNLREDPKFEWSRLSEEAQQFVRKTDSHGYKSLLEWIKAYESVEQGYSEVKP